MASSAVCAGKTMEAQGDGVTPSFLAPVLEMHAGWGALPRTLGKSMEEREGSVPRDVYIPQCAIPFSNRKTIHMPGAARGENTEQLQSKEYCSGAP